MTAAAWHARLVALPTGTRVVLRYLIPGGATDALGDLIALDGESCVVRTRRGEVAVPLHAIVAGKPVPPPPARSPGRRVEPGAAAHPPE